MNTASPPPAHYTRTAIALHWVLAAALLANFVLGIYMHELPFSMTRLKLYNWHKWAGITILTASLLRLVWRLSHRPPAALPMPRWQAQAAHAAHLALYALFFAVPLTGWAYSSAAGFPVVVFGVLPLPDFVPVDRALADIFKGLHKASTLSLAAIVTVHVAAALKHQFMDRDGLLQRMRPGRS